MSHATTSSVSSVESAQVPANHVDHLVEEAVGVPEWLNTGFPWAASFLMHMGVFLLLAFTMFAVQRASREDPGEVVIPTGGEYVDGRPTVLNPGTADDPTRSPAADTIKEMRDLARPDGWAKQPSPTALASMLVGDAGNNVTDVILRGGGMRVGGVGTNGSGQGEGGVVAPYGVPGGGNGGPGGHGIFEPVKDPYKLTRVVYILDTSGSMIDVFDYLRKDVKKSVDHLLPMQQYGVVVFSEKAQVLADMSRATIESKRDLATKIHTVVAQGQNDYTLAPYRDAFAKAFAMKPQLIYFLTDGAFDPRLIAELNAMNKDRKVKINTIACLSSEENAEFLQLYDQLSKVAKEHNGRFRKVEEKDMVGE